MSEASTALTEDIAVKCLSIPELRSSNHEISVYFKLDNIFFWEQEFDFIWLSLMIVRQVRSKAEFAIEFAESFKML